LIEATAALDTLEALLAETERRRRLVSVTVPVELSDPSAAVFASRLAGIAGSAGAAHRDVRAAALGSAHEVVRAPGAPRDLATARKARGRLSHEPDTAAAAGPAWPRAGVRARRRGAPGLVSALMVMPELALHRAAGRTHLSGGLSAGVDPAASSRRLRSWRRCASVPAARRSPSDRMRIARCLRPDGWQW
jgi:hypothetical protein